MKRITTFTALVAFALCLGAAAYAQSSTGAATTPSTTAPKSTKTSTTTSTTHHSSSAPKVDLNTASKEELMKLPGVGDATADKIIAGRPYASKSDLKSKKIVSSSEYSKLSAHVVAKKPAATPK